MVQAHGPLDTTTIIENSTSSSNTSSSGTATAGLHGLHDALSHSEEGEDGSSCSRMAMMTMAGEQTTPAMRPITNTNYPDPASSHHSCQARKSQSQMLAAAQEPINHRRQGKAYTYSRSHSYLQATSGLSLATGTGMQIQPHEFGGTLTSRSDGSGSVATGGGGERGGGGAVVSSLSHSLSQQLSQFLPRPQSQQPHRYI